MAFFIIFSNTIYSNFPEKPIGVVVTAKNTASCCLDNIASIFTQDYSNFHVIFIDDCSKDDTFEKVQKYVVKHKVSDKITMIRNSEHRGKVFNIYNAYHSYSDHTIICQVDGDDRLDNDQVFKNINKDFTEHDIWIRYGSCRDPLHGIHHTKRTPEEVINTNNYRHSQWLYHPPRVFYALLFKLIRLEDFISSSKAPSF